MALYGGLVEALLCRVHGNYVAPFGGSTARPLVAHGAPRRVNGGRRERFMEGATEGIYMPCPWRAMKRLLSAMVGAIDGLWRVHETS